MDTSRIRNTLIVGSDTVTADQLAKVREILSTRYGGVTMIEAIGSWVDDADTFQDRYSGALVDENAYIFELSVPLAQFDANFIKSAFGHLREVVDWIHWEKQVVDAAHFQIGQVVATTA